MSQRHPNLLLTLILAYFASSVALQNIECGWTRNQRCDDHISCNEDEDCVVTCHSWSCISASIYCPLNGNCTIICEGPDACKSVHIYANSSYGDLDLICQKNTNPFGAPNGVPCDGIKVYGSTLQQSPAKHFHIVCEACRAAEIYCAHDADCQITCNGTSDSCSQTQIHGPLSNELQVECHGTNACLSAIISASEASNLFIDGCSNPHTDSCRDLTVYCPSATDAKHCHLEGDNNLALIQLYAVGGWSDINIDYFGEYFYNGGTMHCGTNYSISCDIMNGSCEGGLCTQQTLESTTSSTDIPNTFSSTNVVQMYTTETAPNTETLPPIITATLAVTNRPNLRDAPVKEYTTTMTHIITEYVIVNSQNKDRGIMVPILISLCCILACVVFVVICFWCVYCVKRPKKEMKEHVIVHHVAAASNSNTSTVATNQSAPSTELSCIPEAIEGPAPGTVNSDDVVVLDCAMHNVFQAALDFNFSPQSMDRRNQNRLSTLSPSSYLSNMSDNMIIDSVHLDEEVLGSDEELDVNDFRTPKGGNASHDNDDIGSDELVPGFEKMQSEGGEQYHKLQMVEILEAPPANNDHVAMDQDVVTRFSEEQYQATNMNVVGEMNKDYPVYMKHIDLQNDDEVIMECVTAIGESELLPIPVDNNEETDCSEVGNMISEPFVD